MNVLPKKIEEVWLQRICLKACDSESKKQVFTFYIFPPFQLPTTDYGCTRFSFQQNAHIKHNKLVTKLNNIALCTTILVINIREPHVR